MKQITYSLELFANSFSGCKLLLEETKEILQEIIDRPDVFDLLHAEYPNLLGTAMQILRKELDSARNIR